MKLSRAFIMILRISFSLGFLLLFLHRVKDFEIAYFKFSLIELIYTYHLSLVFYLFALMEIFLVVLIFFTRSKFVKYVVDGFLVAYISSALSYFVYLYYNAGGCIECNYTTHFLSENIRITIVGLAGLALLYFIILRNIK